MLKRALVLLVLASAVIAVAPAPASAGGCGSNFWFGSQYLIPGQAVSSTSDVYMECGGERDLDRGYYAFLVPASRGYRAVPPLPAEAILVDRVELTRTEKRIVRAEVGFTIPRVAPGRYLLQVCDRPCTTTFASLGASEVLVVENALEVRLLEKMDRLMTPLWNQHWRLDARIGRVDTRSADVAELRGVESGLRERIMSLDEKIDALRAEAAVARAELPRMAAIASGMTAGALLVLATAWWVLRAWRRRRRASRRPDDLVPIEEEILLETDDELVGV